MLQGQGMHQESLDRRYYRLIWYKYMIECRWGGGGMKEERLRRLLEQIENMSDEEFVQMLEKAGMIVEDIPLGADPEQVIIEMAFEHDYTPRRKPRRTWNVMGPLRSNSSQLKRQISSVLSKLGPIRTLTHSLFQRTDMHGGVTSHSTC